jgi:hypothetical protein
MWVDGYASEAMAILSSVDSNATMGNPGMAPRLGSLLGSPDPASFDGLAETERASIPDPVGDGSLDHQRDMPG